MPLVAGGFNDLQAPGINALLTTSNPDVVGCQQTRYSMSATSKLDTVALAARRCFAHSHGKPVWPAGIYNNCVIF